MWCLISQANSIVIEVQVDQKAKGQECLEKVCDCLGIISETDYFGLKFESVKGQDVWLNLRNPIQRQVVGVPPHRFKLRVKFWVPPHLLLLDATRHQFYLNAKLDLLEGRLKVENEEMGLKVAALIAQAETGDLEPSTVPVCLYSQWCQLLLENTNEDTIETVATLHRDMKGMKSSIAEYWVLKEIAVLGSFGEELFTCKNATIGIGPHGLTLYKPHQQSIPYTAIRSAASHRRVFQLHYINIDNEESTLELKLENSLAATAVYRALTEKHAFYSCETVRGAVTAQFIRDLKGTIASIFNEASPLGKKYVFDIRRTCREVHDNARRALYQPPEETCSSASAGTCEKKTEQEGASERLARLLDALTCRICMDAAIDTVFFPCAHVIACSGCADRCDSCPLCRSSINESKRVYLPLEQDFNIS
uniref:RING-type E3 ubiquitin transferase n=2 Tax=Clastoptera arizonana TaxID=38151 RepID=A0A1B6C8A5_9HEMI